MRLMKLSLITLLMFISIFSIGFASWIITEPELKDSNSSIRVDSVASNQYVLFGNKKDAVLKYTQNGFVKDVNISYDDEGNEVVNYVKRNIITIPTTIEIDQFKTDFDPNNENESLVLKVRLTLKFSEELQSKELTKINIFDKDFIEVQVNNAEDFKNIKQSGNPVVEYLADGIQIDLKFDLKQNVGETTLEKFQDHKYDLVFTFNESNLKNYHYYVYKEDGSLDYSRLYNFFSAEDSPFTKVETDENGESHIFDIQSLLTVNPD